MVQLSRRMTACPQRNWVKIVSDWKEIQGKKVNSHNPKTNAEAKVTTVRIESDHENVRVIKSNLQEADELSISDDPDAGGDPYNSTGQHVILKAKRDLPD